MMKIFFNGSAFLLSGIIFGYFFHSGLSQADENCITDDSGSRKWNSNDTGYRPRLHSEEDFRDSQSAPGYEGYRPRPGDKSLEWRTSKGSECKPKPYDPSMDRGYRPRTNYYSYKRDYTARDNLSDYGGTAEYDKDKNRTNRKYPSYDRYAPELSRPDTASGYPGYTLPAYPYRYGYPGNRRYQDDYYSPGTMNFPFTDNMWDWMPFW